MTSFPAWPTRPPLLLILAARWCLHPLLLCRGAMVPAVVHRFDARGLQRLGRKAPQGVRQVWNTMHLLAALQGVVNRHSPQLFCFYCSGFGVDTDAFGLDWFGGEDGWLSRTRVEALDPVEEGWRASK